MIDLIKWHCDRRRQVQKYKWHHDRRRQIQKYKGHSLEAFLEFYKKRTCCGCDMLHYQHKKAHHKASIKNHF